MQTSTNKAGAPALSASTRVPKSPKVSRAVEAIGLVVILLFQPLITIGPDTLRIQKQADAVFKVEADEERFASLFDNHPEINPN